MMRQMHRQVFDNVRNAASNVETIECIDEFSILSEKMHLTMKLSDALTSLRVFVKKLHLTLKLHPDDRMHWQIWRWCQKNCILMIECIGRFDNAKKSALNDETIKCTGGFPICLLSDCRTANHWRWQREFKMLIVRRSISAI